MFDITAKRFTNEAAARKHLEAVRWPDGPICPHCGVIGNATRIKGKTARKGLWSCSDCRRQYTVTVGTVFERSKIPLHKWLLATELMCSSKKGISAHQLHRMLGITYKSAWFMAHRIREGMRPANQFSTQARRLAIGRPAPWSGPYSAALDAGAADAAIDGDR